MAISRVYLDEILGEVRKSLPGWMYAALHVAVKAAEDNDDYKSEAPTVVEKLALTFLDPASLENLTDGDLEEVWIRLAGWYLGAVRTESPTDPMVKAGRVVMDELQRRKRSVTPTALGSEVMGLEKSAASIVFVSARPDESQEFRAVFKTKYLDPLNLSESDVWQFNIVPENMTPCDFEKCVDDWTEWAEKRLEANCPAIVVSLGKAAKAILGTTADFSLPHPTALSKFHDSGEVGRKLRQIAKRLTTLDTRGQQDDNGDYSSPSKKGDIPAETIGDQTKTVECAMMTQISKADSLKHIVYGIVMDPYGADGAQPDAHNDYLPPATIELAAHEFLGGDMTIGRQHESKANAQVVESSVEQYPTTEDYQKAIAGEDHSVLRRAFGDDVVHSGSWIMGVKLGDAEWAAYESGELNAFSPGGVGYRQEIEPQEMPNVTFIDLVEKTNE